MPLKISQEPSIPENPFMNMRSPKDRKLRIVAINLLREIYFNKVDKEDIRLAWSDKNKSIVIQVDVQVDDEVVTYSIIPMFRVDVSKSTTLKTLMNYMVCPVPIVMYRTDARIEASGDLWETADIIGPLNKDTLDEYDVLSRGYCFMHELCAESAYAKDKEISSKMDVFYYVAGVTVAAINKFVLKRECFQVDIDSKYGEEKVEEILREQN